MNNRFDHFWFIRRCIELAENGRGKTAPNPLVGCVIVKGGSVITEGRHEEAGGVHAETAALRKAGELARGSKLYVSLEPCCSQGKQPPCADAILRAGIKTVVFGARDPSNAGKKVLERHGIEVIGPVMEAECRRQNRGFFSLIEKGRPWVTIKKAFAGDGKIARRHVTSEEQDKWSHSQLRAKHDAILAGSGTILADNPQLNIRLPATESPYSALRRDLNPRRVILDPNNEIPRNAKVLTDEDAARTLVINDKLPIHDLLLMLKNEGITSVLVEGGQSVWQAFEESGCVDEVVTLVSR